jgi:hypothetical protein
MNARRGVIAAALLAATAWPCAAQDQPAELPSWRLPGWSFTPALGVGLLVDTNIALSSPRASVGETQGDTVFGLQPSGQLRFIGRRTDFHAAYRGHLRRYFDTEGLDGFNQRATVGFEHAATRRLSLYLRNSFADAPTTDDVEVNGVPFRRVGSRTDTLAAGADVRLTKFTTLASRYDMTWVAFDQPDDPTLTGGWIHALRADLTHQIDERTAVGAEYGIRRAELNAGSRDMGFQDVGGVLRLRLGPHTTVSAAAGLSILQDHAVDETRTGPYVRTGISHQADRVTVGAGYQRNFVPSFGFGGSSRNQEVSAFVTTPLDRARVYVQGSATWRRSTPFDANSLELDTIWLRSTLGYAASRWARIEGLYTYTRQDSIVTGGEIDRHRLGVQVVISQPMRIR